MIDIVDKSFTVTDVDQSLHNIGDIGAFAILLEQLLRFVSLLHGEITVVVKHTTALLFFTIETTVKLHPTYS